MLKAKQFLLVFSSIALMHCGGGDKSPKDTTADWKPLFSGKDLSGWDTYIGPSFDTIQGKRDSISPGLNNDPLKVFTVVEEEGKPALRISGQRFGGISTLEEFQNYHLRMEMKWGTAKWPPRKNQKRDSGILYHAVGPHGADFGFWMSSQEFQVQEGDCGDYWGVAGGSFDVPAIKNPGGDWVYDGKSGLVNFSEKSPQGRHVIKSPDGEKPTGKWNVMEVICFGDSAIHVVNGAIVMRLYHSQLVKGETQERLARGKIQLQSEGAEVFYRSIEIRSITEVPKEFVE
jgi:hypothetical protein